MNFQALILRLILLLKNSDNFSGFDFFVFIRVHPCPSVVKISR